MNISLSELRSNNDNSLTPEGITEILKEYKKSSHCLRTSSNKPHCL